MSEHTPHEALDPTRGEAAEAERAHEIVERARRDGGARADDHDESEGPTPDGTSTSDPSIDEVHEDEGGDVGEGAD